eukprot:6207809-Ditylum_brightwellii.AAC.1
MESIKAGWDMLIPLFSRCVNLIPRKDSTSPSSVRSKLFDLSGLTSLSMIESSGAKKIDKKGSHCGPLEYRRICFIVVNAIRPHSSENFL